MTRREVLALYRSVLKAAAHFPSKKRGAIVEDIKAEFREGRASTGEAAVQRLALAQDGLQRLRSYSGLDSKAAAWDVSLAGPTTA
jgi:hypothetical protein